MSSQMNQDSEKIRILLNSLQSVMPILSNFPKLKFKIPILAFKYYQNYINTMILACKKNYCYVLSLKLFKSLFEGNDNFLEYTKKKEEEIKVLIQILQKNNNEKYNPKNIVERGFNELNTSLFEDIYTSLNNLKIDKTLISIFLLYLINNGLSVKILVEETPLILKERFPQSNIYFGDISFENFSLEIFISQLIEISEKFDNYCDLRWDPYKEVLTLSKKTLDEVMDEINTNDNMKKDNKVTNKKIKHNQKLEKACNELNQEKNEINMEKEKKNIIDKNIAQDNMVNELNKELDSLRVQLLEKNQLIEEQRYYLSMIGLRAAYKTFIDIFIYIFNLDGNGNIDYKVKILQNYLDGKKGKKLKLREVISDMLALLKTSNYKAHFIDFSENILQQILKVLFSFKKNNIIGEQALPYNEYYKDIVDIVNTFNINNQFYDLIKLRTKKFEIGWNEFVAQEKKIIKKIKYMSSYESGMKFLNA